MPAPANRSTFSTHPMMGLPPRWKVGDMDPSYDTPQAVVTGATGNSLSNAFNPYANEVALTVQFSAPTISCALTVLNDDGTGNFVPVATFNNVSESNDGGLLVGQLIQNITLQGRAIKVQISNWTGAGTLTVNCKRMN
jgi:hypothetical protein